MNEPISKENIPRLKKMFEEIEEDPNSYEFRDPVPWKDLGLNDYPEIIKRPMDLSTCRKNMVKQKYKNYTELFNDLQLIWDNCKTYNPNNSVQFSPCSGSTTSRKGWTRPSRKW